MESKSSPEGEAAVVNGNPKLRLDTSLSSSEGVPVDKCVFARTARHCDDRGSYRTLPFDAVDRTPTLCEELRSVEYV